MNLTGKIALITGASKGIGAATAIKLAMGKASVIISYKSDKKSAEQILKEVNKYSSENIIIETDITNDDKVKAMFETIKNKFGKLDILINSGGAFYSSDTPTNLDVYQNNFNVNFLGQIRVTKYALELMKTGKIINISSIHGRLGHGGPRAMGYASQEAALESYTKNLARALAPKILVNAVAPGRTLTPRWGKLTEKEKVGYGAGQLIDRFIEPEEIAHAITFLLENDAMCGEVLTIDGGMSLKTLG